MKYKLKNSLQKPSLVMKDNIVTEVNEEFIKLTGFYKNEIIKKTISEVGIMIKIDSQIDIQNINKEKGCYIFAKSLEVIKVTILSKHLANERILYFIKHNSNIKEKFDFIEQLYLDRKTGIAINSVPDLILLKANQNYLDFLDEPYNEMRNSIGKRQKDIVTGYEGSEGEELWNTMINGMKPYYTEEFQYNHYKRGVTYWDTSTMPIFINGKMKYIIQVTLDVTEKVLIRKSIEIRNQELEAIIENVSDGLFVVDKNYNYNLYNKNAREFIYRYNSNEKIKNTSKNVKLYNSEKLLEDDLINKVLKGERLKEYGLVCNGVEGTFNYNLSGSPIYDKNGSVEKVIIFTHDITDRLKNEENLLLKTQYDLLSGIINNIEVGVVMCTYPEFKIIDMNNKSFNNLKKMNPEMEALSSFVGQSVFDVIIKDKQTDRDKLVQDLIVANSFIHRRVIDGEEKFLKIFHQPLYGLNKQIVEVIFISTDITEEVKAKNDMEKNLKAQEELFINISHELKTPLNVIFSANQLMETYLKSDLIDLNKEIISRNNNVIKQNCYRLLKLTNNILDLSKFASGFYKLNLNNDNMVEIVENIVQEISEYVKGVGISVIFDTDVEEKIMGVDYEQIERVILNLVSNAIKFSDIGNEICVNFKDLGDFVEISVEDNGKGIDNEYINLIFDKFYQVDKTLNRNAEGSGMGLALIKSIVELHNGKVSVDSEVDKGSTFKIILPVSIVENSKPEEHIKLLNDNIDKIKIEFSDIYSI